MPTRCTLRALSACARRYQCCYHVYQSSRNASTLISSFVNQVQNTALKYQIYTSKSNNPFLNLSIEHFLLQKSPADSTILFFYIDRPSVVIGRNQNPWLEANLKLLASGSSLKAWATDGSVKNAHAKIDIVRRRSGGGAVFHDHGNVNYCVICPTQDFTRDKHAEMVVRAIRQDNPRARVNERHDIVLDQGQPDTNGSQLSSTDMHKTGFQTDTQRALKVSGSAYKLTRTRSLHHGTCLLDSPNLQELSQYLKSPARPFLQARGVDSVRSPVGNVYAGFQGDASSRFQSRVLESFGTLYGLGPDCLAGFERAQIRNELQEGPDWVCGSLDDSLERVPEIHAGMKELQSAEWIYGQTPQFFVSTRLISDFKNRCSAPLPDYFPETGRIFVEAKSGVITTARITTSQDRYTAGKESEDFKSFLIGLRIYEVEDFNSVLRKAKVTDSVHIPKLARWLNEMFAKNVPSGPAALTS
ncbi:Biotin/lipoate A/B protein ligase [Xylographa trunciseda]|nr:Biotin/lipoate A/B protein ligase [Xylographa trunciseda]